MEPGEIKRLDEVVVNRIAAGEIIQRPASAIKELIENSIDAKATTITITVKSGGLKYLQIQDNGTGIRKDNLDIVCERFTTSKLTTFEDLSSMRTYGFRGEALASISHIAHLTIQTKTVDNKCAFRATYEDGKLSGPIKPCAGNQGTQITVEDLFFNVKLRRQALTSPHTEYQKIADIVTKYAIHNPKIAFTLKKFGETKMMKTQMNSTNKSNISVLYGSDVGKELLEIEHIDDEFRFKFNSLFTNPDFAAKKNIFIFFINHRLVDSSCLKTSLEEVFQPYLNKGQNPFVYLSLEIEPNCIDVNIHPTKHEVKFLYQNEIINRIVEKFEEKLKMCGASRKFIVTPYVPEKMDVSKAIENDLNKSTKTDRIYDKDLVRCDSKMQKLEKFFGLSQIQECRIKGERNEAFDCNESNVGSSNIGSVEGIAKSSLNVKTEKDCVVLAKIDDENVEIIDTELGLLNDVKVVKRDDETVDFMENNKIELDQQFDNNDEKTVANSTDYSPKFVEDVQIKIEDENQISDTDLKELLIENEEVNNSIKFNRSVSDDHKHTKLIDENVEQPVTSTSFAFGLKTEVTKILKKDTTLTSVLNLRKEIEDQCNDGLRKILNNLVFVGAVNQTYSLIQYETSLYMINTKILSDELFYQLMLYNFENFDEVNLNEPLRIKELALIALNDDDSGWTPDDGPREELAQNVEDILISKAEMLREYFGLMITQDGMLETMPLLLVNHLPPWWYLPMFILRLATEVDWENENECFKTFSRETAKFYAEEDVTISEKEWKWTTEFVLYSAFKKYLLPPNEFLHNKSFLQIATLPNLYKVFERC